MQKLEGRFLCQNYGPYSFVGVCTAARWAIGRASGYAPLIRLVRRMPNPPLLTCQRLIDIGLDRTIEASFCVFGSVEIQHILL